MTRDHQSAIGLSLAAAILLSGTALHIYAVFFLPLEGWGLRAAALIVPVITWLNVGLFIVAHDAMHGSLAPGRPSVNRWAGRVSLFLYAGFSYDRLLPKHFAHHRHSGTEDDPDFHSGRGSFWRWYAAFVRQYFGGRELMLLAVLASLYLFVLNVGLSNLLLFWALPSILSSLQLFYFGTYRPHRVEEEAFADRHRARTNDLGWLASLLTCFHFGYHLEHHRSPQTPWWRLPAERVKATRAR